MTANIDFDNLEDGASEETVEEETPKKRNPLRLVLLVLVILILLCVLCYAGSRFFSGALVGILPSQLQGILPGGVAQEVPLAGSALETPAPGATEALPAPQPGEASPTPAAGEVPATEQPAEQPTQQPAEQPTQQPAEQPIQQPAEQPAQQPADTTPTVEPVPGPTATPMPGEVAPTVVITPTGCESNQPPVAKTNGPYNGMMGKGQAFVDFNAAGSTDPDGTIVKYQWEFGDGGAPGEGEKVTYGYKNIGKYVVILTATDNCNGIGQDSTEVTIVGPTPPVSNATPTLTNTTPTPASNTPTPTPAPSSQQPTMGFCYLVQYGDTLSGIAWYYGLPLADLAALNGVSTDYYVVAGQGLFIPMGPITTGPHAFSAQAGDTIYSIAYQCGLTPAAVAKANNLDVNAALQPGQVIILPSGQ